MVATLAGSLGRWTRGRRLVAVLAICAALVGSMVYAAPEAKGQTVARAELKASEGNTVGHVTIRRFPFHAEVSVLIRIPRDLAGFHGFHVHEKGVCEPPFTSAGGHLKDPGTQHRNHVGDMPPLYVTNAGEGDMTFKTERLVLEKLFDADGSAIIVHYGVDNLAHIPPRYTTDGQSGPDAMTLATGDAGPRMACGVVVPG